MGYYIRVLTLKDEFISLDEINDHLYKSNLSVTLEVEDGNANQWTQLILKHGEESHVAVIERNPTNEELGEEEIQEFLEEIEEYKPDSAVKWLKSFLPKVKVIYAFQILSGADEGDGWEAIREVQGLIWNKLGGIFQADGEGFSNEDGYHILWQFSDSVTGPWNMAVKKTFGGWTAFEMDLGDKEQRQSFLNGKVPKGVNKI